MNKNIFKGKFQEASPVNKCRGRIYPFEVLKANIEELYEKEKENIAETVEKGKGEKPPDLQEL